MRVLQIIAVAWLTLLCAIAAGGAEKQGGEPQLPQLVYSRWAKFCGTEQNAGDVCFTGKEGRAEAGKQAVTAALIEQEGASKNCSASRYRSRCSSSSAPA